tara:strand:- start:605 stop:1261 length:657 start_codon:yes stop_codon:yes gene_type:complete
MATRLDSDSGIQNKTVAETRLDADQHNYLFFAIKAEFDTDTLRFSTLAGDCTIGGESYLGAGQLINVSDIRDSAELKSEGMVVTLTGLDSSILSMGLTEHYQNRPITMLTCFADGGGDSVGAAMTSFKGRMMAMALNEDPTGVSTITISCENRLVDLRRPSNLRYTKESQKYIDDNDIGFNQVTSLQDMVITWGRLRALITNLQTSIDGDVSSFAGGP